MDDDMARWEMDGVLDAAQLWALDGYKGLPRVELYYPVVSMDDPHVISFVVCGMPHQENGRDEEDRVIGNTTWRIVVDMRSKTLTSVVCDPEGVSYYHLMPSRVSSYFNSEPSSSMSDPALARLINRTSKKIKLEINNTLEPVVRPACESSSELMETTRADSREAKILAALQEIPGLDRDDMLKAYRILTHDDSGRRFRSLMGLPMNLRKDYMLMDIKASEGCVVCSSCSDQLQL
nr:unnamed protein product [Digitaria exilis]